MEKTIDQALQEGVTAHKAGELEEAERLYKIILNAEPNHPDANHNLGILAVSLNKITTAIPLLKAAVEANPKIEQFWLSFIDVLIKDKQFNNAKLYIEQAKKRGLKSDKLNALLKRLEPDEQMKQSAIATPSQEQLSRLLSNYQVGKFGDVENLAMILTERFPKHQFAWKVLGAVFRRSGRISEALNANQEAVVLSPDDAEAHNNLGNTLQESRRLDDATTSYIQAIVLQPHFAEAYNNLAVTLKHLGRLSEAEFCNLRAVEVKPAYAEAHNNLGNTLQELGRFEEAEACYKQSLALEPCYAEAHNNLGINHKEFGRLDVAEASYMKAIVLWPGYAEAHNNLGINHTEYGRLDKAEVSYERAIQAKPSFAEAHRHLTTLKKFTLKDHQYYKMRDLYLDKSASNEQLCQISFGLGKACEDLEDFEQAYSYYQEGNRLRKKLLNYDISQDTKLFRLIKHKYQQIAQSSLDSFNFASSTTPIFILGMPRSGTTLIEQIISCHSQISGAGELNFVSQLGWEPAVGVAATDSTSLLNFRKNYLKKLEGVAKGNPIVTDKMPQNFRFIGLLCAALPEAKIVHVKRDPPAVCWANYKQYFASNSIGYAYSLEDIVGYHQLYENLMHFWMNFQSERIYTLDYELLIENQEIETRKLIDYIGLEWDKIFLSPHDNRRSVATASSIQVRRKIYQRSSQQWKKYERFLGDAFDELIGV